MPHSASLLLAPCERKGTTFSWYVQRRIEAIQFTLSIMKRLNYILLTLLSIILVGCLDKTTSNYTPRIANSVFIHNNKDTLLLHVNSDGSQIVLDTISVGDTVNVVAAYTSVGNNLTSAQVAWDSTYMNLKLKLFDDVREVMLETSDSLHGIINLPVGYYYLTLPIEFRALKAGSPNLTFTVESDSKFSPVTRTIIVPIR